MQITALATSYSQNIPMSTIVNIKILTDTDNIDWNIDTDNRDWNTCKL